MTSQYLRYVPAHNSQVHRARQGLLYELSSCIHDCLGDRELLRHDHVRVGTMLVTLPMAL